MSKTNQEAQKYIDRLAVATRKAGWNFEAVKKAMEDHYSKLGLPIPKIVCVENLEKGFSAARVAARDAAWVAARDAAWVAARDAARGAARDAAWVAARVAARDAARGAARDAAWVAARDAARGAARDAARGAARDAAWVAANYCGLINTELSNPEILKFKEIEEPLFRAAENGLDVFFPMKDVLILVPMPQLRVDANRRLHSEDGLAAGWRDGTGYYFLHGVRFDQKLYKKVIEKKLSFKQAMEIVDIDQRWVAIKFLGDKILEGTDNELLDKSGRGNELYIVKNVFPSHKEAYFLRYICPSTDRVYFSGIDPEVGKKGDADAAMAWKHNFIKSDYMSLLTEA